MTTENWINLAFLIVAIISMLIAGGSLWYTHKQWQKVKKKVSMIHESGKVYEILPAWYTGRMMADDWRFGLLMLDGRTVVITKILGFSDYLMMEGGWMLSYILKILKLERKIQIMFMPYKNIERRQLFKFHVL